MRRRRRTPGSAALVLLIAISVLLSACGSRRSTNELRAAASGSAEVGASVATGQETGEEQPEGVAEPGQVQPTSGPRGVAGPAAGSAGAVQPGSETRAGEETKPGSLSRPAQGSPIRIGVVGTMSGVGGTQKASVAAVQAWARATNDAGGLVGHPVEVIVVDDGNDPARLRAAVQQLVEQRGVIAFVGLVGGFTLSQGVVDYLESKRVPVVGGDRLSTWWQTSKMFFPQASAADALIWLHMANTARLAGKGAPIGWLACQEAQVCKDADRLWQPNAAQLGMDVRYRAQVSVAQPSFTSECLRAQRAGVEWFLLATDANSIRRIASSCEQQGYHPRYAVLQTSDEMAQLPALEGGYYGSATFPWVAAGSPATVRFQEVMKRYAPGVELSAHASSGWVAAQLFAKAAAEIGARPTSADVLEGLWRIKDDTLGGITSPVSFVRDKPAPARYCYFPMELRKGSWVATGGATPLCRPPT